jgi:hypothetical protein
VCCVLASGRDELTVVGPCPVASTRPTRHINKSVAPSVASTITLHDFTTPYTLRAGSLDRWILTRSTFFHSTLPASVPRSLATQPVACRPLAARRPGRRRQTFRFILFTLAHHIHAVPCLQWTGKTLRIGTLSGTTIPSPLSAPSPCTLFVLGYHLVHTNTTHHATNTPI